MSETCEELRRRQKWMQAVVTHPGGIFAGLTADAARRSIDVAPDDLERTLTRSRKLSALQRLAIYGRGYHLRLLECFQAEYPCLRNALGDELFNQFVADYLQCHPPTSYTLQKLAAEFPGHLAATRPNADAPVESREIWPDFIVELASLEREFMEVYDGEGVENRSTVTARHISEIDSSQLPTLRFVLSPCVRLLRFRFPVVRYFRSFRHGEHAEFPELQESFLVITRQDFVVRFHEQTTTAFRLLSSLQANRTVSEATLEATGAQLEKAPDATRKIRERLQRFADVGIFLRIA